MDKETYLMILDGHRRKAWERRKKASNTEDAEYWSSIIREIKEEIREVLGEPFYGKY